MPKPIFVLGRARSGTTWIANLLLAHSAIAGVCHEKHWGIHESAFFNRMSQRFGSLENPTDFVEFAHVAAASDYFRLAGADLDYLYSLYPSTYPDLFRKVMDRYATMSNADYWVEKTPGHTLFAESIADYYPDAKFIAIERDVVDVTVSRLHSRGRDTRQNFSRRFLRLATSAMAWQHYRKLIKNLDERFPKRTLLLDFDDLKMHTEPTMKKVCDFLEIDFEPAVLRSPFIANSSFRGQASDARTSVLTPLERRLLKTCNAVAGMTPSFVLSAAYKMSSNNFGGGNLPHSYFRLLPDAPSSLTEQRRGF